MNLQVEHTPGPWSYGELDRDDSRRVRLQDGRTVAAVYPDREKNWEHAQVRRDANARLIAKAPEMLALLRKIHREEILSLDTQATLIVLFHELEG